MSLIQIKYSTVSDVPPSLAIGELAYSEKSKKLFIGKSNGVVSQIGGDDIVSRVGSLESTVYLIQTDLAALAGAGNINISSLEARVSAIEAAMSNISGYDDTQLKQRLNAVESGLATINAQIAGQMTLNDLTVTGDLVVMGQVTEVNSTVAVIEDPVIRIGTNTPSAQDAMDRGVEYKWYDSVSGTIKTGFFGVDQSDGKFKFVPDATQINPNIFSGNVGTIQANIDGNSSTATRLTASRKISLSGDVSGHAMFDGGTDSDIAVSVVIVNGGTF